MSDELIKVAAEYDAAGRIMARGFVEEMNKMAHNLKVAMGMDAGPAGMMPPGPQYGGGLGNLGKKKAPKFTDKMNPTDKPGMYGAGTGDNVQKNDREDALPAGPGKRPPAPRGAGDGKGPGSGPTHLFMQD